MAAFLETFSGSGVLPTTYSTSDSGHSWAATLSNAFALSGSGTLIAAQSSAIYAYISGGAEVDTSANFDFVCKSPSLATYSAYIIEVGACPTGTGGNEDSVLITYTNPNCKLGKIVGGTYTELATLFTGQSTSQTWNVSIHGTTLTVNGTDYSFGTRASGNKLFFRCYGAGSQASVRPSLDSISAAVNVTADPFTGTATGWLTANVSTTHYLLQNGSATGIGLLNIGDPATIGNTYVASTLNLAVDSKISKAYYPFDQVGYQTGRIHTRFGDNNYAEFGIFYETSESLALAWRSTNFGTPTIDLAQSAQASGLAAFSAGTPASVRYEQASGFVDAPTFGAPTVVGVHKVTGFRRRLMGTPALFVPPAARSIRVRVTFGTPKVITTGTYRVTGLWSPIRVGFPRANQYTGQLATGWLPTQLASPAAYTLNKALHVPPATRFGAAITYRTLTC